jgi:hypothetical protein
MDEPTIKGGSAVPGEITIHGTVRDMTEGEAQMTADRILALCDVIEHLPRSKNESD